MPGHTRHRHEAAVTDAGDGDAFGIGQAFANQVIGGGGGVVGVAAPQIKAIRFAELATIAGAAAIVRADDHVAASHKIVHGWIPVVVML